MPKACRMHRRTREVLPFEFLTKAASFRIWFVPKHREGGTLAGAPHRLYTLLLFNIALERDQFVD